MQDVGQLGRWGRDLGGIVEIAGVSRWAVAGDAGAVLRGSQTPAPARAVILVGSEHDREAATQALTRTGQYRRDVDGAPLHPTWQGWSRQVVSHGSAPAAAQPASAQVAVLAVPEGVAQPIVDEARIHAVQGIPVPSPSQLIALGVLMPEGSVGSLNGRQVTELASTMRGWSRPSEWFGWMSTTLPEINRVTLGQAIGERYEVERDAHYKGGEQRLANLQTKAGVRPEHMSTRALAERVAGLDAQFRRTSNRGEQVRLRGRLTAARELQGMWAGMNQAPGQWWVAYGSYIREVGRAGLSRGTSIWPTWGAPPQAHFLHVPPSGPDHGLGR